MLRRLLLILSVFITSLALAQPANDNCSGALNLGTLGSPGPCGTLLQNGATTTIAGTNVAATPENPYVVLGGCNMASPANSVWYRFTAPVDGYGVVVNITGATFATPNIALYNGSNCNNLVGISCIVGAAGTATLNVQSGIVPGQVYYIQVSGDTGDEGTFTLNVNAYQDCSDCMNASTLTVSPLPVNGTYLPGQAVTFCFHISEWTQVQNNWLHGVQLSFGSGWDLTTLTTTPSPTVLSNWNFVWWAGLPSCGYWQYYPTGITSSVSGAWPPGFYFNGTYSNSGNSCLSAADGNPGNNFGDGFGCSGCTITTFPNEWTFCWTVHVLNGCNPGMSLNMTVNTSGDGESGNWSNPGCLDDPAANFSAIIACCPPNISATSTCVGQSTGTATATPVGSAGPYVYSWAPGGQSTQTAAGLTPGTYTVNVTDANLCETSATVSVPSSPIPVVTPISNSSACAGSVLSLPAFASNVAGTTFTWTNSNPAIGLAASGTGNLPSFTATNATLSPLTGIITVTPTGPAPTFCVGLPITFTILVKQFPTVSVAGPNQTFCNTASTHMAGNAPAVGTGVWTLVSGAGTFTAPTSPLALVSGLGFGANVFQWTISNSPCPPSSSQVTITNVAPPTVAVAGPNQTVCGTTSATLAGNTALVGTGTWTLVSGSGTITTPSSPTSGITGLGNGANVFQWTITNPPCPPSTSQVTITITPMPVVTVNSPSICLGDVANLTANGATSYAWTAGVATVTANTGTASPLVTTTYTVTGTTGACSATAISMVTVNPIPVVTVNSPTSCAGQTVNLAPTGATTYTWSAGVSATGDVAPLVTTSYTVTGTSLGCSSTAVATVTVSALPMVTVNSPTICEGQTATLIPNGATSYTWTAGVSGTNTASPLTTTS